ncbi:MAG: hypothetical protein DRQ65_03510 [Gammaproteobacteria bacterium]|nr:MAG: hypothetical protein DRQ98_09835 [Gammaproteobacteria bacterium]RLA56089.1 MAG: hypothetical protein DRQ65_03510 [Gammaproteobacteria bacterium]HDY83864.1 hypothetical protein [Halieaceae bacterium]
MSESTDDTGVLMARMERLKEYRIPNVLAIKAKVDKGERINDYDTEFLGRIIVDLEKVEPMLAQHPQYQTLYDRLAHLYMEITEKALENEQGLS